MLWETTIGKAQAQAAYLYFPCTMGSLPRPPAVENSIAVVLAVMAGWHEVGKAMDLVQEIFSANPGSTIKG